MYYQTELSTRLQNSLSHSQMQFLQMLSMTNQELDRFLAEESLENPLLERSEASVVSYRFDSGDFRSGRKNYDGGDEKMEFIMNLPEPEAVDLRTLFTDQLNMSEFTAAQWEAALFCIDHLDERGYFDVSPSEISAQKNFSLTDVNYALHRLRKLEPCGCFAADLSECLLLQMEHQGVKDEKLKFLVSSGLDDLLKQRIVGLSKKLDVSAGQIRKYIAYIATLNPKPLAGFQSGESSYIIPDIVCSLEDGVWSVGLNASFFAHYDLSDYYCMMMREAHTPELKEYFAGKLRRTKMILSNIDQRRKMILQLTELLLERQQDYFCCGGPLRPFTMANAAEILGVHPSTITRTIQNKWIQWPGGISSMKNLFPSCADSRLDISGFQIKEVLNELVRSENPEKPYKDSELANLLGKRGLGISRRTVAKYRAELGILSWYDRRAYA